MTACKNSAENDLDYVEDSEPERKRIRYQAAKTRKRRTRHKQLELRSETVTTMTIAARGSSPSSQIQMVDDTIGYEGLRGVTTEAIPESIVIDIIDDARRSCSIPPSESPSPLPAADSRPRASSQQLVPGDDTHNTLGTASESNIITCLGHLAYRQAGPVSDNVSDSRARRSRSEPTSEVVHNGKIEKRSQSFQPDSNVTKLDVGPLLRCVSCDVQWTVRKSAAHKSTHMTTCARKKRINPSTLQLLIEKELLKIRRQKTNDQKQSSAIAAPQTYLGTVVAEAQPRRKQRRTDTVGTLQPISQTRAAILDRAKALLGTREAVSCIVPEPEPEQTQSFGRSKLVTGQAEIFDSILAHSSEESAFTSRLALLRSMAETPTTYPP